MAEAAAELIAQTPGLVLAVTTCHGSGVTVLRGYGLAGDVAGTFLPIGAAAPLDKAALDAALGARRDWRSIELDQDPTGRHDGDLLLVGLDRRIPDALLDSVRTLSAQTTMAESACHAHAELSHQAHHDELTAMPNRAVFFSRLSRTVEAIQGGGRCAVMIIDLDDFKLVNDTLGHGAGDGLLVEIGRRMLEVIGEHGGAARLGGDEFAVLLPDLAHPELALDLAGQLRTRLLEAVELPAGSVTVGCSIGVAYGRPGCEAGDLMRQADIAMYAAKAGGKNRVEDFSEDRHGGIAHDRRMQDRVAGRVPERVTQPG